MSELEARHYIGQAAVGHEALTWAQQLLAAGQQAPILAQARAQGLRFVADNDARPVSSGNPEGALWDDSADPIGELRRMMAVRRAALLRYPRIIADAVQADLQIRAATVASFRTARRT